MSQPSRASTSSATSSSSADRIIDGDLAALGDTSLRHAPSLDDSLAATAIHRPRTPSASAYRDDLPGAEARRNALADARRRELALMPLTMSQIYAHRVGRAAAGVAAIACALGLLVILDDAFLVRLTAYFIPGFALGVYALVSIATVLVTYNVAHFIAEQRFTARMRDLVSKGPDAYLDLDQLAVGPFAVAAEKVRGVDRASLVLPLAGAALLAPLLAFVGYVGLLAVQLPHGRSNIEMFMDMTRDMGPVVLALLAGAALAVAVGHALRGEARGAATSLSSWVRWLGHWSTLVVTFVLGIVVAAAALRLSFRLQAWSNPPAMSTRYLLALGGEALVVLPAGWFFLWWRRRERTRMGDLD